MSYFHNFTVVSGDAEELHTLIQGITGVLVGVVLEAETLTAEFSAEPSPEILTDCQAALASFNTSRPMQSFLDGLETQRRRRIRLLKARVAVAMLSLGMTQSEVMAEGAAFYGRHGAAIYGWETGAAQTLLADVQADPATWLSESLPGGGTIEDLFVSGLA